MATFHSTLNVRDCIEELVRFTLYSYVKDTTQFDFLNVSRDFCSTLLLEDPDPNTTDLDSIADATGVEIYRKFYSEDREQSNGALEILISKATFHPYMSMASLSLKRHCCRSLLSLQQVLQQQEEISNGNHAAAAAAITVDMQRANYQQPRSCHALTTSRSTDLSSSEHHQPSASTTTAAGRWASKLLRECATAISERDSTKIHHLLWMLNELASPYGDCDQKLASYFLQALFCKATDSSQRCYKTLNSVSAKNHSFDSARKLILKFQEVSPWTTFGHVASNGAILEALEGETKLHIIDISYTLCTQWPILLEALATRNDETPHLKLTLVLTTNIQGSVMKEVCQRMEKFARLMGVPFELNVISGLKNLGELSLEGLGVQEDEGVAINCIGALRRVRVEERDGLIQMFQSLKPRVVTVVEEEADFSCSRNDFVSTFEECLRFYALYFEMLEESFFPTSNERLMLEKECSKSIVRVLACNDEYGIGECERRERGSQWSERLIDAFSPAGFSEDVVDDVKALLKRYRTGWSMSLPQGDNMKSGIYLTWKDEPVVWASAWKT